MNKPEPRLPFGIPRDLAVLSTAMVIWGLGEGLFIFFYPLALQRWNTDPVQIGGVLSLTGGIMAMVQLPAGYLSDRFGARPLIRAGFMIGVASVMIMAVAQTLPVFVIGMLAYGLTSFVNAPVSSYVTSKRGSWSVQRAVTFNAAAFQLGAVAGPMLGGWIGETAGLASVFHYSTGLFIISTLVVFLARRPDVQGPHELTVHVVSPLANPRFFGLLVIVFFTIFALNLPQQLTPIYLQDVHHLSIQQIGVTGTLASLGTVVIMLALGSLRAPAGMLVGQLLVGGFSLLMWRGQSAAVFFSGYLLIGGYRLYRSMALAFARPLVKAADIGLAYGLVETGSALATILSPLAAGFLYNYRPEAVYITSLVGIAICVVMNSLLQEKRKVVEEV